LFSNHIEKNEGTHGDVSEEIVIFESWVGFACFGSFLTITLSLNE